MREYASCGACRFGFSWDGEDEFECRIRAPLPGMERWPRINRYDWCGEFSQEEAHAELAEVATTEVPRKRKNMKVLRLPAILAATGWAKATVYAKISQGKFPKPFKLDPGARAVVWWEEEITEWQNAAMAQSRK